MKSFQVMVCPDFPLDLIIDAAEFTQHADSAVRLGFKFQAHRGITKFAAASSSPTLSTVPTTTSDITTPTTAAAATPSPAALVSIQQRHISRRVPKQGLRTACVYSLAYGSKPLTCRDPTTTNLSRQDTQTHRFLGERSPVASRQGWDWGPNREDQGTYLKVFQL